MTNTSRIKPEARSLVDGLPDHGPKCDLSYDSVPPNVSDYRFMEELAAKAIAETLSGAH